MVELKLYNTLGREVQIFTSISPGKVRLYACGPTVYEYQHIGNLRTYLFEDVLRRVLEHIGYEVTHVMNVTDVGHLTDDADDGEDKMLKSAREKEQSVWEISRYYADVFFRDCRKMNILPPTVICRATDHIQDMIDLIRRLEERGYTYAAGGNIYFDIRRFPDYGRMALLDLDQLKAGARIQVDPSKRNPLDFALWFTRSKFEHQAMLWDSPWGKGYPGWHIECSAMSMRYLGERIDIHCGGVDHIAVHHTNEIAQSEAATGETWVNYWMHGEHLVTGSEKMAKSAGGFLTLSDLIEKGYEPMDYRYYLLGAHYRTQLQFHLPALDSAKNARRRLGERILELRREAEGLPQERPAGAANSHLAGFLENAANDFNMPRCLADVWGLLKDGGVDAGSKLAVLYEMDRILGLGLAEWQLEGRELSPREKKLIEERRQAREQGDYRKADEIRNILEERGILLEDTSEGTRHRWK